MFRDKIAAFAESKYPEMSGVPLIRRYDSMPLGDDLQIGLFELMVVSEISDDQYTVLVAH